MNLRYAKRSEDTEQINVTSWAAWNERQYPELKWLHHIPNGGSRNKAEAVKLKQMGVKAGVSDLCLPYPKGIYCGLYIEMKFGDGKHQKSQKEFLTDMAAVGHYVATCYTSEDAVNVLREYCELLSPQWMKEPNNRYNLRVHSRFSMNRPGFIKIYQGDGPDRKQIIKVEEDDDVACYKRAIDELESWARSLEDENARYRTA